MYECTLYLPVKAPLRASCKSCTCFIVLYHVTVDCIEIHCIGLYSTELAGICTFGVFGRKDVLYSVGNTINSEGACAHVND